MANEQNLIPVNKRTKSEQREIQKKGGIASGETRRKKKSMKQAMNTLLSLPVTDDDNKEKLISLGIDPDDADNQMVVMATMMQKALNGNVSAAQFIASITGNVSMSESEREKIKLEKKRLKLEEKKSTSNDMNGTESVVIYDDIPKPN